MKSNIKSIRRSLLLWLILGMLIAISIAGLSLYWIAQEEINELFDYQLKQVALSIQVQNDVITLESTDKELEEDNLIQIWNAQSRLIYNPKPARALPRYKLAGLQTVSYQNKAWRIFILQRNAQHIQVAQLIEERNELAASLAARMLLPFLMLIPLLAGLIWLVVGRSLRPLQAVASAVAKRHQDAMQPIDEIDLPIEVQPMVAAINQLLQRLNQAIQTQRAFIADAAHELRTPLTALKLQLQLTARANKDTQLEIGFSKLNNRLNRCIHLVGQLLNLARSEVQAATSQFESVNLSALAHKAVQDFMAFATIKHIELRLEASPDILILGQQENLRILISNLIDNAIRYTPSFGQINVSVKSKAQDIVLCVADNGHGIPPEEHERVLTRFYRREGTETTGSGLGLAIVHNIAQTHDAKLELSDNLTCTGLVVTITFPENTVLGK
jgi:two-component system OmpR family sensor kinase